MVCQLLAELKKVMKRMPGMRIKLNSVSGPQWFPCEKHKRLEETLSGPRVACHLARHGLLLSLLMNAVFVPLVSRLSGLFP